MLRGILVLKCEYLFVFSCTSEDDISVQCPIDGVILIHAHSMAQHSMAQLSNIPCDSNACSFHGAAFRGAPRSQRDVYHSTVHSMVQPSPWRGAQRNAFHSIGSLWGHPMQAWIPLQCTQLTALDRKCSLRSYSLYLTICHHGTERKHPF